LDELHQEHFADSLEELDEIFLIKIYRMLSILEM